MIFLLIVTLTSMLLAAIMSVIAWRIAGDERRRSEARVAVLAAEIHEAPPVRIALVAHVGPARPATRRWDEELELRPAFAATHLFAPASSSGSRSAIVFAVGALVLCASVAFAILLSGRVHRVRQVVNPVAVAPAAIPLELVALGHQRDAGQLTVRGVVRNPPAGTDRDRLTAVVFLFTADGGFLTSGRAAFESPGLHPGGESTFVVTVPGAVEVGRYRVSFRTDDHIVPHVDRRHGQS